jgi:HlyD family secretion protein
VQNSMDRELSADIKRKIRTRMILRIAVAVLLLIVGLVALRAVLRPSLERNRIRTSVVEIGPIEASVTASGVTVPEYEQTITSPVQTKIVRALRKSGDTVKAGESVVVLDKEALESANRRLLDELEVLKNRKQQLTLELQRQHIDFQARYDVQQLQTRFKQSEMERTKHLYDLGGATRASLDMATLDLEIAQRELLQLSSQVENQKAALDADLRELDLNLRIQQSKVDEMQRQVELANSRADRDGVVTWVNDNIGSAVSAGEVVARVADLGSYRVEAKISDLHVAALRTGGPVTVRIGERDLRGRIAAINPAVQNGVITFSVELVSSNDSLLRPNLRADVYVVTSRKDRTCRVKNGPFYNGVVDQKIFVVKDDKAVRRTVSIGVSNIDFVELEGDIAEGEEVIISDMKAFVHMDEIDIDN